MTLFEYAMLIVGCTVAAGLIGVFVQMTFYIEHPGFFLVWWTPFVFAFGGTLVGSLVSCLGKLTERR